MLELQLLVYLQYECVSLDLYSVHPLRNVAKMEDAKVEIDDGKDETVVPDTMYQ